MTPNPSCLQVISIISFTAQCLGCCQRRDLTPNAPARWNVPHAMPVHPPPQGNSLAEFFDGAPALSLPAHKKMWMQAHLAH